MKGQRVRSAVAPALARALARTLALFGPPEACNLGPLWAVAGAAWVAEQVTGEGGATPPSGRPPRPGFAQRVRPVGSLPLRPLPPNLSPTRRAPITKRASFGSTPAHAAGPTDGRGVFPCR